MISVLIPTYNEEENIKELIPKIKKIFSSINDEYEIIIADAGSKDKTVEISKKNNVSFFIRKNPNFASAIIEGIPKTRGDFVITMDADFSHNPNYIKELLKHKNEADIIIASRWVNAGSSEQTFFRKCLSIFFNYFYKIGLSMNLNDMNSNYRLYRKSIFSTLELNSLNSDVLPEILIKAKIKGYKTLEIPFHYFPRKKGRSKLKLLKFSIVYFKRFLELWRLRNSADAVDYDERAFLSMIPLQRYWQRKRFRIIINWLKNYDDYILDIGCGSSMIIQHLFKTSKSIAFDFNKDRVRYLHNKFPKKLMVIGNATFLPFKENTIGTVILSNVIEHIKIPGEKIITQIKKILKSKGCLILATPDFSTFFWNFIEKIYDFVKLGRSYKKLHIMKYSSRTIKNLMKGNGFSIKDYKTILSAEIITKNLKRF